MDGDQYEGAVYVNGVEFWVRKEHTECTPWDVDEYDSEEVEVYRKFAKAA